MVYCKLFRTDIIKKNNVAFRTDIYIGEDYIFNFDYLRNCSNILCIPYMGYHYVCHNENSLTHKKEFKVNGQSIFLTYYDCPNCGRRHFVQIDDAKSLEELKSVTADFRRLSNTRLKGKNISKKQSENFKKARQHLSDYRTKLMKEFSDKIAIAEDGREYILRFSV